jgi:serine/threonine protein phosphatase PrpC
MTVVCAACGKVSRDQEFCDHCNADLQLANDRLPPVRCPLPGEEISLSTAQRRSLARVEDATTIDAASGRWRIHWIPAAEQDTWRPLLEDRLSLDLEVLSPSHTIEVASGIWVVSPALPVPGRLWRDHINPADPFLWLRELLADVASLAHSLGQLHRQGRVWLTFDPAAIEDAGPLSVRADPRAEEWGLRLLRITNLDLRLFRQGECPPALSFHASYAAPELCGLRAAEIGPATDVYHLAMFAFCWCAGLLPDGFAGSGLAAFEHRLPALRPFAPNLPAGIIPAILRGLAVDPRERYATPEEFVRSLRERLAEAERRQQGGGPVSWDAAAETHTGRSKDAMGRENEDHCLLRSFTGPPALLAAVADGISTCDVGSGALASLIASIVLENVFDSGSSHDEFPRQVAEACQKGSERILEWGVEKGYREQLALGLDLMGTTLTVAWLQGGELSLSNLGDSRAYLITADWIDQLTVDGDLGTELLARGAPPEQIVRMGIVARALRGCVGGCTLTEGRVELVPESSLPSVSRWPLMPGDVILLCTDGLIEEGFFLEPEAVAELVRSQRALPPAELARRLVEAADAVQRLPSESEPEGFGDNITCVVIKIERDEHKS